MNNSELIARVALRSGVSDETCREVLRAFEEILSEGISEKKWKAKAFASVTRIMNNVQQKRENRNNHSTRP